MDSLAQMFRMASFRIHQSLVQKPLSLTDFWPLWADQKQQLQDKFIWGDTIEEARENYRNVLRRHNLLKDDNLN